MFVNATKFGFPARMTQSGIRSLLTEPAFDTWIAPIYRDAVLMNKNKRHWSVSLTTYKCTTYGLSDDKVATSIIDVVIIIDEIARADVPFVSQTIARLAGGGFVERALGGILSRAHRSIGRKGAAACCHKKTRKRALPETRTRERTIYPGIHGLYHRLIYTSLFSDRCTISALPRYEERDVSKSQGGTLLETYGALYFTV